MAHRKRKARGPANPFRAGLLSPAQRAAAMLRLDADWTLVACGAALGVAVAFVALGFILPIRWAEHALEGALRGSRESAALLAGIAPVLGAIGTVIVYAILPMPARGHGVTQVLYAVHRSNSRLPGLLAVRQWIAATLTIVSGGSAGPEGPIVTIGATVGSNASRLLARPSPGDTATLLGCGAAAGLAAVFAAPLTGIFFVMEVVLRDFSARTFAPIVVASVLSFATVQTVLGPVDSLFGPAAREVGPQLTGMTIGLTPFFVSLALVSAVGAVFFMRSMEIIERVFGILPVPKRSKPVIGAAMLGLGGAAWVWVHRESPLPPFFGSGYWVINDLVEHAGVGSTTIASAGILLVWFAAKTCATGTTLGSGSAGGLFAPSLVCGAMVGGAFAEALRAAGIASTPAPGLVLAGMGCMVAATTHAPLAGAMLVYELCHQEAVILPVLLATVVATLACRAMHPLSMYTAGLASLGVRQGVMADLAMMRRMTVGQVGHLPGAVILDTAPGTAFLELADRHGVRDAVVVDDQGRYRGTVTAREMQSALLAREALPFTVAGDLMRTDIPVTDDGESIEVAFHKLSARDVDAIAVVERDTQRLVGVLTRERLMQAYAAELARDA
jgi:chloride channel protein, CIC family